MKNYTIKSICQICREASAIFKKLNEDLKNALTGLEEFSHACILWWFNKTDTPENRKTTIFTPPFEAPELRVFASIAPFRANPIGLSVVQIESVDVQTGLLDIREIDALDETPVLDIKPYMPNYLRVQSPGIPNWASSWPSWIPEEGIAP